MFMYASIHLLCTKKWVLTICYAFCFSGYVCTDSVAFDHCDSILLAVVVHIFSFLFPRRCLYGYRCRLCRDANLFVFLLLPLLLLHRRYFYNVCCCCCCCCCCWSWIAKMFEVSDVHLSPIPAFHNCEGLFLIVSILLLSNKYFCCCRYCYYSDVIYTTSVAVVVVVAGRELLRWWRSPISTCRQYQHSTIAKVCYWSYWYYYYQTNIFVVAAIATTATLFIQRLLLLLLLLLLLVVNC